MASPCGCEPGCPCPPSGPMHSAGGPCPARGQHGLSAAPARPQSRPQAAPANRESDVNILMFSQTSRPKHARNAREKISLSHQGGRRASKLMSRSVRVPRLAAGAQDTQASSAASSRVTPLAQPPTPLSGRGRQSRSLSLAPLPHRAQGTPKRGGTAIGPSLPPALVTRGRPWRSSTSGCYSRAGVPAGERQGQRHPPLPGGPARRLPSPRAPSLRTRGQSLP